MSDTTESDKKKGFFINSRGISCIPCRCKRQSYHKETITTKENNIVTTNVIEDRKILKWALLVAMCHPMETIYLRTRVKSEALKYAILVGALITE